MNTPNTLDIPGTGLSYAELCDSAPGSPERTMWSALTALASVLDIPLNRSTYGSATKTIDELIADITPLLPTGMNLASAALATAAQKTDLPERVEFFQVKRLARIHHDGTADWTLVSRHDTPEDATAARDWHLAQNTGDLYLIQRIETTQKRTID